MNDPVPILPVPAPLPPHRKNRKTDQETHERAVKARNMVEKLRRPHQEISQGVKRKIPQVISAPPMEKKKLAEELLAMMVQQRGEEEPMYKSSKNCLLE